MKLLLDTHVVLWWLADHPRLPLHARAAIGGRENEVLVSIVSFWEIAIKVRAGLLEANLAAIIRAVGSDGFVHLPIAPGHIVALMTLPIVHRDPFDHLLLAQAIAEDATLVSANSVMARYPVELITL